MAKFTCRDYGFECDFVAEGDNMAKVIEEYGKGDRGIWKTFL